MVTTSKFTGNKMVLHVMTDKVPLFPPKMSVSEIIRNLKTVQKVDFDSINYIYAVNDKGQLIGVSSIKEILRSSETANLSDIMKTEIISVREHSPQEKAALLAIKHNIKALPVINKENIFLGVIPSDEILAILQQENIEDLLHTSGVSVSRSTETDIFTSTVWEQLRMRLPWLLIGLFGGIFAASIVSAYDHLIAEIVLLAAFLPGVIYIGDAVGAQSQMIIIRSLSQEKQILFRVYVSRELKISTLLGVVLGVVSGIVSQLFWQDLILTYVVSISFFLTSVVASIVAVSLPFLFQKLRIDPAIGAGPIATVLRDVLSILVYFSVAMSVLYIIN